MRCVLLKKTFKEAVLTATQKDAVRVASLYTLTCVYNVTPCSSHNQCKSIPNELRALALFGVVLSSVAGDCYRDH